MIFTEEGTSRGFGASSRQDSVSASATIASASATSITR